MGACNSFQKQSYVNLDIHILIMSSVVMKQDTLQIVTELLIMYLSAPYCNLKFNFVCLFILCNSKQYPNKLSKYQKSTKIFHRKLTSSKHYWVYNLIFTNMEAACILYCINFFV